MKRIGPTTMNADDLINLGQDADCFADGDGYAPIVADVFLGRHPTGTGVQTTLGLPIS